MEETIGCKTVQQLETFLQEEYHAQPVEPVDYLLYNARQQMLNLFYPQQMQQLAEQIGFGPESDEEICALFDCLTETFDRETAGSRYVQYCFTQTLPEGVQAVFYVTVERVSPDLCFRSLSGRQRATEKAWGSPSPKNSPRCPRRVTACSIRPCEASFCIRVCRSRIFCKIPRATSGMKRRANSGTAFAEG